MKNLKLFTAIIIALTVGLASCTKEGAVGPAGTNGNANVKTIMFNSVPWQGGIPKIILTHGELTASVIENDAILLYAYVNSLYYPIPGPQGGDYYMRSYFNAADSPVSCTIKSQEFNGNTKFSPNAIDKVKMVIIKSNSSISAMTQLDNAGIDIKNYEAVENFFGIE